MEYYCLACRTGSEELNMKLLRKLCATQFEDKLELQVYSPKREVKEFKLKNFKIVNQPILPGYVIVVTEYDLTSIAYLIRGMSSSSYGLVRNTDHTYALRGSDRSYAAWIASFDGVITESRVIVSKNIQEGTKVTVLSGPMKDLKGKIVRIYKKTRCLVEIPFLGETRRINLPINIVEETGEGFDTPEDIGGLKPLESIYESSQEPAAPGGSGEDGSGS